MTGVVEVADIADALKDHGLEPRGGFNFLASDDAPPAASGKHAASALLVGQVGAANWPYFQAWSDGKSPPPENPLDTWSREIIERWRPILPQERCFHRTSHTCRFKHGRCGPRD